MLILWKAQVQVQSPSLMHHHRDMQVFLMLLMLLMLLMFPLTEGWSVVEDK